MEPLTASSRIAGLPQTTLSEANLFDIDFQSATIAGPMFGQMTSVPCVATAVLMC